MPKLIVNQPVYQQLNRILRSMVHTGQFRKGAKFFTERQICRRYGVSRATANKAVSNLVAEGMLEYRKGIGTFVGEHGIHYDLRRLVSFTEKAVSAGRRPSTEVTHFEKIHVSAVENEIASLLRAQDTDGLFFIKRIRRADSTPVILEQRYVAAGFCPGLTRDEAAGSIYEAWTGKYGLDITGAYQTIHAVNMTAEESELLCASVGAAGMLVVSVGYVADEHPLWYERTLYRGDAYEFRNRLGPLQGSPAVGALLDVNSRSAR